jgi:MarR-like DNA-binding transcriptional regulator SgrR of sgrS sRNA
MTCHASRETLQRVRDHYAANPHAHLTAWQIADLIKCSRRHAQGVMQILQHEGVVERVEVYRVRQGRVEC